GSRAVGRSGNRGRVLRRGGHRARGPPDRGSARARRRNRGQCLTGECTPRYEIGKDVGVPRAFLDTEVSCARADRMSARASATRIQGYCALCVSRCGSIAVVEDGRFVALEPDPSHPTGQALCAKGRAAPELVYHPERLLHPLKRTPPQGDADPGWQRISWDEALDLTATRLRKLADEHGPESVVFSMVSPSTSAIADSAAWIQRLGRAFGSPNHCGSLELCGWGRGYAT